MMVSFSFYPFTIPKKLSIILMCSSYFCYICYFRYSNYGKVTTRFLSIQKLERATAANCYGEIIAALHEYCGIQEPELWSKLVGFGSDGASVMTGRRSGVGARMKEHQPKLQTVHCIAHRLELAIKQASKNVPMVCKMDQFLINIFLFYHNSTLNRGLLRRTAEALGVTRFIPTRTGGTRWIGHTQNALTNLLSGYPAIVQHLLEVIIALYLMLKLVTNNITIIITSTNLGLLYFHAIIYLTLSDQRTQPDKQ